MGGLGTGGGKPCVKRRNPGSPCWALGWRASRACSRGVPPGPAVPQAWEQSCLAAVSPRACVLHARPRPPGSVAVPGLLRAVWTVPCTHGCRLPRQAPEDSTGGWRAGRRRGSRRAGGGAGAAAVRPGAGGPRGSDSCSALSCAVGGWLLLVVVSQAAPLVAAATVMGTQGSSARAGAQAPASGPVRGLHPGAALPGAQRPQRQGAAAAPRAPGRSGSRRPCR